MPAGSRHPCGAIGNKAFDHRAGSHVVTEGDRYLGIADVVEDFRTLDLGSSFGDRPSVIREALHQSGNPVTTQRSEDGPHRDSPRATRKLRHLFVWIAR